MATCSHPRVFCINPHEIVRKYKCQSCDGVMMCACEEEFARRYLPHQIDSATDPETRERIPITLGFQNGICNICRGLPEVACPRSQSYGAKNKIVRYYWREIQFETIKRFGEWANNQGYEDWIEAFAKHKDKHKHIEKEVIDEIKKQHKVAPKYSFEEISQREILVKNKVEVINLSAVYAKSDNSRGSLLFEDRLYSVEEFAALHFSRQSYRVIYTESIPFHVIFGTYMWIVIQDPQDPKNRLVMFGDRHAFDQKTQGEKIRTFLPEDFGTSAYYARRASVIEEHFLTLGEEKEKFLWLFDYWTSHSSDFRQYLWAHRYEDVKKSREILSVLPVKTVKNILKYLVANYWKRYLGWPDMLVCSEDGFFFAEIKSSKDKLSEHQKNWINDNTSILHLPFKLVKIHKMRK